MTGNVGHLDQERIGPRFGLVLRPANGLGRRARNAHDGTAVNLMRHDKAIGPDTESLGHDRTVARNASRVVVHMIA